MSVENQNHYIELLREKLESVTNENNELKERLSRIESFKKTGNSAA